VFLKKVIVFRTDKDLPQLVLTALRLKVNNCNNGYSKKINVNGELYQK